MLISRCVVWMFSVGMMVVGAGGVSGQNYPNKPIRVVTTGAGGGNDFVARLLAQGLTVSLGQQVIIDNRAVIIAPEIVLEAPPDGYTLLVHSNSLWLQSLLRNTLYDSIRDFSPVILAARAPNILVVHPSVTANSVKELIALAKAKPGALNYAASGVGGPTHLAAELFNHMAGVNIVRISYKSSSQETAELIGGQVQLTFGSAASVSPHVKSGKLRALAVTTAQPTTLFPGLPTVAASLPGYEAVTLNGVFTPAKTPEAIINQLNQEIVRILNRPDVKEKLFHSGVEAGGGSPEQLAVEVKSEIATMGKVIKDAGIRADY
jgi:tripartite-type tricarboxylate transporter receptor subunit TctC